MSILTKVTQIGAKVGPTLVKHSPTMLIVAGTGLVLGAGVLAAKSTMKLNRVMDTHEMMMENVKDHYKGESTDAISPEHKKDKAQVYLKTSWEMVKLYGPSVTMAAVGVGCLLTSHHIMRGRNLALVAAVKAVESQFSNYRGRVVEEYGEEKDRDFYRGVRHEKKVVQELDEKGKVKKTEEQEVTTRDPNKHSVYAKFFDCTNPNWDKDPEMVMIFLQAQQNYYNNLLLARGEVLWNDVLDGLGMKRTKLGAVSGWSLNNPVGDKFIDFGIFDNNYEPTRRFVNGEDDSILLDFNCQGYILDRMSL